MGSISRPHDWSGGPLEGKSVLDERLDRFDGRPCLSEGCLAVSAAAVVANASRMQTIPSGSIPLDVALSYAVRR